MSMQRWLSSAASAFESVRFRFLNKPQTLEQCGSVRLVGLSCSQWQLLFVAVAKKWLPQRLIMQVMLVVFVARVYIRFFFKIPVVFVLQTS